MVKASMIKAPKNQKYSLNIQEVKNLLNLCSFAMLLILNCLNLFSSTIHKDSLNVSGTLLN